MAIVQDSIFEISEQQGANVISVPLDTRGLVLWGPYQRLKPGDYEVQFEIRPSGHSSKSADCCEIDIAANSGATIVAVRRLSVGDLLANDGKIVVAFSVSEASDFEFRVRAIGASAFDVTYMRMALPVGESAVPNDIGHLLVYQENIGPIEIAREAGARFFESNNVMLAEVDSVQFEIRGREDLQVLSEVFTSMDYNVVPPFPCVVFDVGMNIGLTSLFLATKPNVETVYAYEPFETPFRRAKESFSRNAKQASKIQAINCGLADRDETLDVKSNADMTISTSIRGVSEDGNVERIVIRDAGAELGPKILDAESRGLGVVLKVDCEGSEFAIFESLQRHNLLPKIDAFMVEWHKWWSADKTQADLIAPLHDAGFIVFDKTHESIPFAGFFYAVRSAKASERG